MRQQVIALLALSVLMLLPIHVIGQNKDSSTSWPSLGSAQEIAHEGRPRFIIESQKLEIARNVSNPLGVTRCLTSSQPCVLWIHAADFFSEWKGRIKGSVLRPDLMMHHYADALLDGHFQSTGTYVFYLPKQKVFYLWGDCAMGHADLIGGPFAGDPRLVLKRLADDPDSVAQLGFLRVPFKVQVKDQNSGDDVWPPIPSSGIDISKLERARNVFDPLSLDRCRPSPEECVMNANDFSYTRRDQLGKEKWVLRPGVIAHYYPGQVQQYVFYLPKQKIFYVGGYDPSVVSLLISGPFAGDPRLELKK